jgi:predicted AlkP superfamily phosphohydrolase/phosphomutase
MLRGEKGTPKPLFGLVYASGGGGYDRVRICRSCNGDDALCDLGVGEWSDWWLDSFEIDGEMVQGHVKCKLITLTPDADSFELYFPQIWPTEGYTKPAGLASELVKNVGPFLQNPGRDVLSFITDDTYFEMLEYHHNHLADVTQYLAKNYEWDMLFCETHASDYADHFFLPQADEISDATPEDFKRCREGLIRSYQSIDRWIGRIMEIAGEDTVVVVASDHGGTPAQFTPVEVTTVLEDAGLLVYDKSGEIDLSRSRAVPVGLIHVFVNLKGREPNGIVEPEDYDAVRREVIAAIMEYKDAETGRHPFTLALTREDAEIINLWSDLVGDVVYAVRPEFDGAHGRHMPVSGFGISGQHSTFVMAGPGVRASVALERQVRVIDVAPTLCHLLGLPMPRDVEGGIIYEALEDPDWYIKGA